MRQLIVLFTSLVIAVTATPLALPRPAAPDIRAPEPAALQPDVPAAPELPPDPSLAGPATAAQISRGARVYRTLCAACHMPDGKGMATVTPPLAGSDFMHADRERAILTVLKGLDRPITVNGRPYAGVMPALEQILTDEQVADVLTYSFNTWGNSGQAFDPAHVARRRSEWSHLPRIAAAPTTVQ